MIRAVVLLSIVVACGRVDFDPLAGACAACDDGNPCTDDTCVAGGCAHVPNTSACDDGDACTTNDQCALGVCGGGAVTGCAGAVAPILRSVSASPGAPLANGTGLLAIAGTTATFTAPLPDSIGVGDALEYDSNDDGTRDALAFIYGRLSAQVYLVRTSTAATPLATTAPTTSWEISRAYLSLADAVDRTAGGTHNPNIATPFDGYAGGRDLVANNEQWSFACYDDGVIDADPIEICSTSYTRSCTTGSWNTDASHFLRIYTPTATSEVGVTQRHDGTFGTGYQRSTGIILYQGFVHLDGISLQRTTVGNGRAYYVETQGSGGEIWISNCLGWSSLTDVEKVYDFWDTGVPALGPTPTICKLWNDIAYNSTLVDTRSGFYFNSNRAEAFVYNCTAYVASGGAFYESSLAQVTLKNCLGYSAANPAFKADDSFLLVGSSASNDSSLTGIAGGVGNQASQTITFKNAANQDYHLDPAANASLLGTGLNLSTDATLQFTTDIDGDPRPPAPALWDIGADQVTP